MRQTPKQADEKRADKLLIARHNSISELKAKAKKCFHIEASTACSQRRDGDEMRKVARSGGWR